MTETGRTGGTIAVAVLVLVAGLLAGCGEKGTREEDAPADAQADAPPPASTGEPAPTVGAIDREAWLARADVVRRPSGLAYRVLRRGDGAGVRPGEMVVVHYEGRFLDGRVFDSSFARGAPARFPSDQLIRGWVEALSLMHEGDEWELLIPAGLAYGSKGAGGVIPPDTPLFFRMRLIRVERTGRAP